jgi:hypothetical protein
MSFAEQADRTRRADAIGASSEPRALHLFGLGALVVLVAISGAYLFARASGVADPACQEIPDHRLLPDYFLVLWSVAFVYAGRVLGPKMHGLRESAAAEQLADTVGIMSAMLFFGTVTFALIYEGVGVQASLKDGLPVGRFHQLEPITYYVRCAIFYDKSGTGGFGISTYLIFALTAFLAGHWLWPRNPPKPDSRQTRASATSSPSAHQYHYIRATLLTLVIVALMTMGGFAFLSFALAANPNTAQVVHPELPAATVAATEGTFHTGILAVIVFVTLFFMTIAALDWFFAFQRWDSIGLRVQRWARAHGWFAFGLLMVVGALVAHFAGNEIQYS